MSAPVDPLVPPVAGRVLLAIEPSTEEEDAGDLPPELRVPVA